MQPLVSVICLCYNHESFLLEALDSVINQTYQNLEVVVVDDASSDSSPQLLQAYQARHPEIKLILHTKNTGNCKAFNEALAISTGEYIIDFATDDVLLINRIAEQVSVFEQLDKSYGVIYTDAELINNQSEHIGYFYKRDKKGKVILPTPSGYIFIHILRFAFLCPPTLMFRRYLMDELGGYDETLAYEDFDIWVRSAQEYQYFFLDKVLTQRRVHAGSLSHKQYKPGEKQLASTVKICKKAQLLIQNEEEKEALIIRVKSEIRQAFFTENFEECGQLLKLLDELSSLPVQYQVIHLLNNNRIRLGVLRDIYNSMVYGKN